MAEKEYTYYVPILSSIHALYAKELADILASNFGWVAAKSNKPAIKLVSEFAKGCEAQDDRVSASTYYETRHGLRRVFLFGTEYLKELVSHIEKYAIDSHCTVKLNGTEYHIKKKSSLLK